VNVHTDLTFLTLIVHASVVVQAIMLLLVAAIIVINTLVDITYALLDPRIELKESTA
jgi:ABC-type dipeptide/oligopeptide/nickel transport system permease component